MKNSFVLKLNNNKITISNSNGMPISELYFIPSYFVWEFSACVSSKKPIIISKEENDIFYSNIKWLMDQSYQFPNKHSIKSNDKLIWLSEHCFDIEDEYQRDITPRLIIEKRENLFNIYYNTPIIEQNSFYNSGASISFAPAGNGYLTKNLETGSTLQDDLINVFYYTLNNNKINNNKTYKKKR